VADRTARRILIVEDEFLLALHLEDLLTDLGHQVIGVATRLAEALEFSRDAEIDFAVLDINLAGAQSFPVADVLRQRNIPFVFASGYGSDGLVDGYLRETVLRKPYESQELAQAVASAPLNR
jgi:CheY-like chemotaxis protein